MQIIEHSIAGVRSSVMTLRKAGSGIEFVLFPMVHVADRDNRVVAALTEIDLTRAGERIRVAVVYGAYHVPGILTGLAKLGYRVREADWVTVIAG